MFGRGEEILLILLLVLVLFGGAKIPELMRGLGEGMREFKKATREDAPREENTRRVSSDSGDRPFR